MWLNRADYDRLVRQLESATDDLRLERAENRRTERWMCNMLMRRAQTFPVPSAVSVTPTVTNGEPAVVAPPVIDPGERAAMLEVGASLGIPADEVDRLLAREHGLERMT